MRNPERTAMKRREECEEIVRPDTIVVASGRYGSCNQYTQWLIDRLGADAIPYNKQSLGYVSLYKNVIYIGAIKDGAIMNVGILWQNYNNFALDGKKIIVCGVGLGDPENEEYFKKVMRRSGSDQGFCSTYILPGRIDTARLKFLDRPQFNKFLVDADRIYGTETADLIRSRAEENYNGVDVRALEPVINEILVTRG